MRRYRLWRRAAIRCPGENPALVEAQTRHRVGGTLVTSLRDDGRRRALFVFPSAVDANRDTTCKSCGNVTEAPASAGDLGELLAPSRGECQNFLGVLLTGKARILFECRATIQVPVP